MTSRNWLQSIATVAVFGCATAFLYALGYPKAWMPLVVGAVIAGGTLAGSRLRRT